MVFFLEDFGLKSGLTLISGMSVTLILKQIFMLLSASFHFLKSKYSHHHFLSVFHTAVYFWSLCSLSNSRRRKTTAKWNVMWWRKVTTLTILWQFPESQWGYQVPCGLRGFPQFLMAANEAVLEISYDSYEPQSLNLWNTLRCPIYSKYSETRSGGDKDMWHLHFFKCFSMQRLGWTINE